MNVMRILRHPRAAVVAHDLVMVVLAWLAADIVDRGIVMTGGGALIRGLDRLVQHETNLPIHVDEEPLTCVVRGAGRILDDVPKYRNVLTT